MKELVFFLTITVLISGCTGSAANVPYPTYYVIEGDANFDGNIIGGFDGNIYSWDWALLDNNAWLKDLNMTEHSVFNAHDVNTINLCFRNTGNCMNDVPGGGSGIDTNIWTEQWAEHDTNALMHDLNGGGNQAENFSHLGIGMDNPVWNIDIDTGGGLADWIRVRSNNGTRTFASELDASTLDMMLTGSTNIPWRFIVGGIPTLDLIPIASDVHVAVYDSLRWYDDEDRDGNYSAFEAYSDLNVSTTWILPIEDGNNAQVLATDGSSQLYWKTDQTGGSGIDTNVWTAKWLNDFNALTADLNFNDHNAQVGMTANFYRYCFRDGSGCFTTWFQDTNIPNIFDGNVYSLGILSDNNVWQIDLNTIGDVNGLRLCINGDCINAWSDVNFWIDTNISDTNVWTAKWLTPDYNLLTVDLIPFEDADFGTAPNTGIMLGNDDNRFLRLNSMSWYTGLLDEDDTETAMFEGTRRCWNCSFNPPPDFNYTHDLIKSGFGSYIDVPEWRQSIPADLSGGLGPLTQNNISFQQQQQVTLSGEQTMNDLNTEQHWWRGVKWSYPGKTSTIFREGVFHTGARYDTYNGTTPVALVVPGMGCDVINPIFDEALPNSNYSIQLTGYEYIVEYGEPEPQLGYLHIDGVIQPGTKQPNAFRGSANYRLYNLFGQIITNPATGEAGDWCNYIQMTVDLGIVTGIAPEIDWTLRMNNQPIPSG